jgi:hypothetical protein
MTRGLARRGVPVCQVLLAVAFLAGCGGSQSEDDPAAARQEFITAGDAICADAQLEAADLARRAQELQAQSGTLSESEQLDDAAELWGDQIEFAERFREQLGNLDPPPGDEARIDELLASLDEGIVTARGIKARLDDGESLPPELVQTYARIAERGNALARAYGFQVCGRSS